MNKLEITGEIIHIGEIEIVSTNAEKRIFVIEIEPGKYSQEISFELFKDKVSLINPFQKGDHITVAFNLRGRAWKDKWFVNLQAWKISASSAVNTDPIDQAIPPTNPAF